MARNDLKKRLNQVNELNLSSFRIKACITATLCHILRDRLLVLFRTEEFNDHAATCFFDVVIITIVQNCNQEFRILTLLVLVELLAAVVGFDEDSEDAVVHGVLAEVGHDLVEL